MIRKLKSDDRSHLENILSNINQFKESECDVALELIDMALMNPNQQDYHIYVFEENGKVLGYYCAGQRPLTDGVFDLYWIVVAPQTQGKGIGSLLLDHAEKFVIENRGRWLLAETSSKDNYLATRKFYLRNNFSIVAEINDFYALKDNLIIFGKYL